MAKIKSKKTVLDEKRKKQIVQNWLSSFLVTAVVVATIITAPSAPTATFLTLANVGTEVYYSVSVVDEEKSLLQDSLKIVAESPLDTQEQTLSVGQAEGFFEGLLPNTKYDISIVGSSGYGSYSLAKQNITTSSHYQGAIIKSEFVVGGGDYQEMLACDVSVLISDQSDELKTVYLKYAYIFSDEYFENQVPPEYRQIEVTEDHFTTSINIPKMEGTLHLILEAVLQDDTIVILDEQEVQSPTIINAYAYLDTVSENQVSVVLSPDSELTDASYYIILKNNDVIIEQKEVELTLYQEYDWQYYMGYVTFDQLEPHQTYELECYCNYLNPDTQLQETQLFQTFSALTETYLPS